MKMLMLLLASASMISAQDMAATEIARSAAPTDLLFDTAVDCLEGAAKILPPKEAAKYCFEIRKLEVKRSTKTANEAADATKNNWPRSTVIDNGWGGNRWGGGGWNNNGWGGGGYRYRTIQQRPPAVRRPPPPPRQTLIRTQTPPR